jgi:hypothetical protein
MTLLAVLLSTVFVLILIDLVESLWIAFIQPSL